jgi:type II secretory pathway pseudopilin PulG
VLLPNNHKGVRWVTLQAGHWNNQNLPDELAHLVDHTGAYAAGVSEVDVNVAVAKLAAQRLYERGYSVEVLDATVPPNYTTDLFLALHADGNAYASVRGFKAVSPWDWGATSKSEAFVSLLYEEYGKATGLPTDPRTSSAMANYYAFNPFKYRHAINRAVPAALLEMGFVTNPLDRQVLATEQDRVAWGIANAVDRYFRSGAAGPTPSPYPTFTPSHTPTRTVTSTGTPTTTLTPTSTTTSTSTTTPTPLPPGETVTVTPTGTRTATATRTPLLPTATRTPSPTSTPLTGTITTDGRWLPPVAPSGRWLPPLGSKSAPVLLSKEDDDPHGGYMMKKPGWHPHIWRQYYFPNLGRSIWIMGEAVPPKE